MKNLKLYEEFEENENDLDSDQDFDLEVEFHEYINDWEKEHAIPMTKSELGIQFAKDEIEKFLTEGGDINELISSLSAEGSILPDFLNKLKSKFDWYNDSLENSVLDKIWNMISDHEDPEDIDWSQDDEEYMSLAGEEEEGDDLEELRQRSYARYAKEDEIKRRKEEIFNKVADGTPLTDEELEFWKQNENLFVSKSQNKRVLGFKDFNN
jgi:uncharacterized coiled-coil DUF342 family protein